MSFEGGRGSHEAGGKGGASQEPSLRTLHCCRAEKRGTMPVLRLVEEKKYDFSAE